MTNDSDAIISVLGAAQTVLLLTHIQPDGDAVGSVFGLSRCLRAMGKYVDILMFPGVPPGHQFLIGDEILLPGVDTIAPEYDAVAILDSGDYERCGAEPAVRALGVPVLNIDHHATNPGYGELNFVDDRASSTSELVVQLIVRAGWPLDAHMAAPLYVGLVSDTRFFQNDALRAETFDIAARLLRTGLDPKPLTQRTTQNKTVTDLRVLSLALRNIELAANGLIAYTTVRQQGLEELGANHRNCWSAGVFGSLNNLGSAIVTFSLIEFSATRTFCEFRSKRGFDVRDVALAFGGGGHRTASGCSPEIPLDELLPRVLAVLIPAVTPAQNDPVPSVSSG